MSGGTLGSPFGSGRQRTSANVAWPTNNRKEIEPGSRDPIAWRCELDRKFHPIDETSYVVYVDDVNQNVSIVGGGAIRARGRHVRRMVVCQPCHRTIGVTP